MQIKPLILAVLAFATCNESKKTTEKNMTISVIKKQQWKVDTRM